MNWLWHFLGFDYGLPYGHVGAYNLWSGFGSDLGEVAILGGVVSLYRKHSCHTNGCWRIGKHTVDGTPWCSRHHQEAREAVAPAPSVTLNFHGPADAAKVGEAVREAVRKTPKGGA